MVVETVRQYTVENLTDNGIKYFFIRDCETLKMVLLPTKYLKHKTVMNCSPNTVKRSAFAICYYFEYLAEMKLKISQIYDMSYSKQSEHFVEFMHWVKMGRHRNGNGRKNPKNGTCNAYLNEVFGFYRYIEAEYEELGSLKVLLYSQFVVRNESNTKSMYRTKSFHGYMNPEERNVRAATREEIITVLQSCTNCRDQLLILILAETGFRIGEVLGIDYTKDIDYQNRKVRVRFREDNENGARAKNFEFRESIVSNDTFEFLMYYLAENRKLLQYQTYLFINISGKTAGHAWKADSVYDMFGRMEKKTGIKLTPHMLRRYFAMERWNAGWPLEMISQALGHRHLETTTKYLSIMDDKLTEASKEFFEKHSDDYGIKQLLR